MLQAAFLVKFVRLAWYRLKYNERFLKNIMGFMWGLDVCKMWVLQPFVSSLHVGEGE